LLFILAINMIFCNTFTQPVGFVSKSVFIMPVGNSSLFILIGTIYVVYKGLVLLRLLVRVVTTV